MVTSGLRRESDVRCSLGSGESSVERRKVIVWNRVGIKGDFGEDTFSSIAILGCVLVPDGSDTVGWSSAWSKRAA
jgi:hypothetical protein